MVRDPSFPDIYMDGMKDNNPYIFSPNACYAIFFYQTRETLFGDADIFKKFVENCIRRFRRSRFYTQYKAYLYDLGLDHCQVLSNIDTTMTKKIEMHHNGLTIFDITIMIVYHFLNTKGKVCTFDVVKELKRIHRNNMVPIVMLSISVHQMVHNNTEFRLPCQMCFGFWPQLVCEYYRGITYGIAKKLYYWIQFSIEHSNNLDLNTELLGLRDQIQKWSDYNECCGGNKYIDSGNFNTSSIITRIY